MEKELSHPENPGLMSDLFAGWATPFGSDPNGIRHLVKHRRESSACGITPTYGYRGVLPYPAPGKMCLDCWNVVVELTDNGWR